MSERLSIAIPVDVARAFDNTATQAQIEANKLQSSADDWDTLASFIEDAVDEFRALTNANFRVSRVGVAGQRETYETVTYDVSGHQAFKRNWSGVTTDYRATEVTTDLDNDRVLPFDSTQGDELYVYRGLGGSTEWEDLTDEEGDLWAIVNHAGGQIQFHPVELHRAMHRTTQGVAVGGAGQLRELRIAISYRYGALGGSRGQATSTALDASLTSSQTGTVAVTDGSSFPVGASAGSIVVLVGREYIEVSPDPANDQMDVLARGLRGTAGASHSTGDTVSYTPPSIRKAVAARAGVQLIQSGRYQSYLPDEDDSVSKSDMKSTMQATWEGTVAAMS